MSAPTPQRARRRAPADGAAPRRTAPRSEGLPVGRVLGVPVVLARSWFVIAVVIAVLFAPTVGAVAPQLGVATTYAVAASYAVLLGLSVLVHELAHAVVARRLGMPVTRIVLTLWGGHTQFEQDFATPGRSFVVAVAGPVANGVLAVLAWLVATRVELTPLVGLLVSATAITNGFVAVFNVLPGHPLDGGRMLEALVWRLGGDRDRGTTAAGWTGRVLAVGIPFFALGEPLLRGGAPSLPTVVWAGAVGAVLWVGAGAALQGAQIRRRTPRASTDLARAAVAVPGRALLSEALSAAARVEGGAWVVLLDAEGAPSAVLDPAAVDAVPVERRAATPAGAAGRALVAGAQVPEHLAGRELLALLSAHPAEEWVVLDAAGRVTGLLLARDVVAAVMGERAAARA